MKENPDKIRITEIPGTGRYVIHKPYAELTPYLKEKGKSFKGKLTRGAGAVLGVSAVAAVPYTVQTAQAQEEIKRELVPATPTPATVAEAPVEQETTPFPLGTQELGQLAVPNIVNPDSPTQEDIESINAFFETLNDNEAYEALLRQLESGIDGIAKQENIDPDKFGAQIFFNAATANTQAAGVILREKDGGQGFDRAYFFNKELQQYLFIDLQEGEQAAVFRYTSEAGIVSLVPGILTTDETGRPIYLIFGGGGGELSAGGVVEPTKTFEKVAMAPEGAPMNMILETAEFSENAQLASTSGDCIILYSNNVLADVELDEIGVDGETAQKACDAVVEGNLQKVGKNVGDEVKLTGALMGTGKGIEFRGTIEGKINQVRQYVVTKEEFEAISRQIENSGIPFIDHNTMPRPYGQKPAMVAFFDNEGTLVVVNKVFMFLSPKYFSEEKRAQQVIADGPVMLYFFLEEALWIGQGKPFTSLTSNADHIYREYGCAEYNNFCMSDGTGSLTVE